MATSIRSMDTDVILMRTINVRTSINGYVGLNRILASNGDGTTKWASISTIYDPGYNFFSTLSTNAGYASFISTIPSASWSNIITSNLPISTVETFPNYTTGDIYFSTVTFSMSSFLRYINPNSTTKMFLEINPQYYFPRFYLGTSPPYNSVHPISTFVQYETANSGRQILATYSDMITSQQIQANSSNVYNNQVKLELDTSILLRNAANDGPQGGYYTIYHRMPGGLANQVINTACGCPEQYIIGARGGFSNNPDRPVTFNNNTQPKNAVFLHVFNQSMII
jgi:hypothetical protein